MRPGQRTGGNNMQIYLMNNKRYSFTLLELIIVVIVVGIMAAAGLPLFHGVVMKAKLAEIYQTFQMIEKAERMYYAQYETYYAIGAYHTQGYIDAYNTKLGINIPDVNNSLCYYGVFFIDPDWYIYAYGREETGIICCIAFDGPKAPYYRIWSAHPWAKYLSRDWYGK